MASFNLHNVFKSLTLLNLYSFVLCIDWVEATQNTKKNSDMVMSFSSDHFSISEIPELVVCRKGKNPVSMISDDEYINNLLIKKMTDYCRQSQRCI